MHGAALFVGHFHAHSVGAGHGSLHAHGHGLERHGQIVGQIGDARGLDARSRTHLEERDHGAGRDARQRGVHVEVLEAGDERVALSGQGEFIGSAGKILFRQRRKQFQRRQLKLPALRQHGRRRSRSGDFGFELFLRSERSGHGAVHGGVSGVLVRRGRSFRRAEKLGRSLPGQIRPRRGLFFGQGRSRHHGGQIVGVHGRSRGGKRGQGRRRQVFLRHVGLDKGRGRNGLRGHGGGGRSLRGLKRRRGGRHHRGGRSGKHRRSRRGSGRRNRRRFGSQRSRLDARCCKSRRRHDSRFGSRRSRRRTNCRGRRGGNLRRNGRNGGRRRNGRFRRFDGVLQLKNKFALFLRRSLFRRRRRNRFRHEHGGHGRFGSARPAAGSLRTFHKAQKIAQIFFPNAGIYRLRLRVRKLGSLRQIRFYFKHGRRRFRNVLLPAEHDVEHRAGTLCHVRNPAPSGDEPGQALQRLGQMRHGQIVGRAEGRNFPHHPGGERSNERQPRNAERQLHGNEEHEEPQQKRADGTEKNKGKGGKPLSGKAAAVNAVHAYVEYGRGHQHAGKKQEIAHPAVPLEHQPAGHQPRAHGQKEHDPQEGAQTEAVHQKARQIRAEQSGRVLHGRGVHAHGLIEGGIADMIAPETEQHKQTAEKKKQSEQFAYQSVSVHWHPLQTSSEPFRDGPGIRFSPEKRKRCRKGAQHVLPTAQKKSTRISRGRDIRGCGYRP